MTERMADEGEEKEKEEEEDGDEGDEESSLPHAPVLCISFV